MPYARICSGYSFKMFFDMSKAPTRLTIGAHVLWYWPHCLQRKSQQHRLTWRKVMRIGSFGWFM